MLNLPPKKWFKDFFKEHFLELCEKIENNMGLKQVINKTETEKAFEREFSSFINAASNKAGAGELAQIIDIRKKAFEVMQKEGLPNRRIEDFKYSDWRAALKGAYTTSNLSANELDNSHEELFGSFKIVEKLREQSPFEINILNGNYLLEDDNSVLADIEVSITSFGEEFESNTNSLIALANSFCEQFLTINIPKNKDIEKPILLNYVNGMQGNKCAVFASSEITLEANSRLIIIENLLGLITPYCENSEKQSSEYFFNQLNKIKIEEGASLIHIRLQGDNEDALNFSHQEIELKKDASYKKYSVNAGGKFVREQSEININGENCDVKLNGAYLLSQSQHCDHNIKMNHNKGRSYSDQQYRGVMVDKANGAFVGKIYVAKGADGTDGKQMSKALLLSDKASHKGKPELEIFADDVKCAHGATVGAIDEKALFFLRARGIDEKSAKALLIKAFIDEVFDELEEFDKTDEKLLFQGVKAYLDEALDKIIKG